MNQNIEFADGCMVICMTRIYEPVVKFKSKHRVLYNNKYGLFLEGKSKDLYFYPEVFILASEYRINTIKDICNIK